MIIKPSIAFEDMRGSAGGVTASKNKSRLYVKNRISPRNPQTSAQSTVRSRMTNHAKAWNALTQSQRDAWDEASKTTTGRRELGEAAKISGFNYFMRCRNNLALINEAAITVPGKPAEFKPFKINNVDYKAPAGNDSGQLSFNIDGDIPNNVIRATAPFSAGKAKNATGLRIVGVNLEGGEVPYNVYDGYVAKFGANFPEGQKIQFEIYTIDPNSGVASLRQNFVWTIV